MTGTSIEPGIIPNAIKYMFSLIEKDTSREFLLRVSYLEIYNEKVNDLLGNTENITLREDANGQTTVKVEERVCNNIDKVLECMAKGEKNRRIGETNMNERSSRSHTIFRVILESSTKSEENDGEGFVKTSQLNLVDLAGSERCGQIGTTGDRFKEGCHINNSLTALALVIKQLSELNDDIPEPIPAKERGIKQTDSRQYYINYRGSKLTRLLKTSLGGNAVTVIICTVTPTVIDQTQNTINFALRSKNVKNKPQLNETADDAALIKRYMRQIANLSQELEEKEKRIAKLKKDSISSTISDVNKEQIDKSKRRRTWGGKTDLFSLLPTKFSLPTIKEDPLPFPLHNSTSDISGISLPVNELELYLPETKNETGDEPRKQNLWNRNVDSLKPSFLDKVTKVDVSETPPRILREKIKSEAKLARILENEYIQLREFTKLEKQIFHTDGRKLEEDNKILDEKFCIALSQIEQLKADKDQLQSELEENVSTLEKLRSKIIDIEVIKETTEKRFVERETELKRSLEDTWAILKTKEATIDHFKENIDQLQSKLKAYENNAEKVILVERNKILEQYLKDLEEKGQTEREELRERMTKMQNENLLLIEQNKVAEDQNECMKTQIEILEAKLKELQCSCNELEEKGQTERGELRERMTKMQNENRLLIQQNKIAKDQNECMKTQIDILEAKLKELQCSCNELEEKDQTERGELREGMTKMQNENLLLIQQNKIAKDQNECMKTQIEILEAKLKEFQCSSIVQSKCQNNSTLLETKEITNSVHENRNFTTSLDKNQEVYNSPISNKHEDLKNYVDIPSTIEVETINQLGTSDKNVSLQDEEQSEYSREEEYVAELRRRNNILFKKTQDSIILKEKIINEIMSLDSSIKNSLQDFDLVQLFEKFMSVLMKKEGDIIFKIKDDFEVQIKELHEKYKQSEGEEKRLTIWIHSIEDENERLSDELAIKKQNIENLQSQFSEKSNELKQKDLKLIFLNKKVLSLQEESLNIQTELSDIKNKHSLCKIPENFNAKLSQLEDYLKKKDITIEIYEERVNKLLLQDLQMSKFLESEKQKNKELLDIHNSQLEELHVQDENCKKYREELKIKNEELNNLILEMKCKENEYIQLEKKIIELRSQDIQEEYEQLIFNLSDCPSGLKNKLRSISYNFKLLKCVIEIFIKKLEEEELTGMKQIKDIEVAFEEKDKICQELQKKLSHFENNCANNSKMIDELKAKDEMLKEVIKNLEKEKMTCSQICMKSEELQSFLEYLKMESNKYKENFIEACKELENLKTECNSEKNNNKVLEKEVEILSQQLKQLNSSNEDFLNKIGQILLRSPSDLNDILLMVSEKMIFITELQEKLETMQLLNQKLNLECTSTNQSINEINEKLLNIVVKKENYLDEQFKNNSIQDISQANSKLHTNDFIRKVLDITSIPGKPSNLTEAFCKISNNMKEIEQLKVIVKSTEEEKDYLDKECDMLYKLLKDNEKSVDDFSRQCSEKTAENIDLKAKIAQTEQLLQEKIKLCDSLLEDKDALKLEVFRYEDIIREHRKEKGRMILQISDYKSKLKNSDNDLEELKQLVNEQKKVFDTSIYENQCYLEELKIKLNELTMSISERDMRIITLELQLQNDTIPLKNQITELEKSLDQAKQMIKEFKSESQEYKKLLQKNCEKCRKQVEFLVPPSSQASSHTSVPTTPSSFLEGQSFSEQKVQQFKNEIIMLKRICHSRNKKIEELEKQLQKEKPTRTNWRYIANPN